VIDNHGVNSGVDSWLRGNSNLIETFPPAERHAGGIRIGSQYPVNARRERTLEITLVVTLTHQARIFTVKTILEFRQGMVGTIGVDLNHTRIQQMSPDTGIKQYAASHEQQVPITVYD
jgi:hypothetical protein